MPAYLINEGRSVLFLGIALAVLIAFNRSQRLQKWSWKPAFWCLLLLLSGDVITTYIGLCLMQGFNEGFAPMADLMVSVGILGGLVLSQAVWILVIGVVLFFSRRRGRNFLYAASAYKGLLVASNILLIYWLA